MKEYNAAYPVRNPDAAARLEEYLSTKKNPNKILEKALARADEIVENRVYKSIHIILYEYPFQTMRPRTFGGHTFSPNAAENKEYFRKALDKVLQSFQLITTPAEIEVEAYLEMPKNVPPEEVLLFESKLLTPLTTPDFDNIIKCYTDMSTNVLTSDDDIFWRGELRKYYSLLPRVEMRIRFLEKHESKYIYKHLKNRKVIQEGLASGQVKLQLLGEG
ncbi:MAG: RusA family crossover junction endodeoxyribonuclease [Muribaculaceae bacterium]|nr:RusA family crossover junction endodeoxyribonuclease [Muribaculaceae bacterium]